MTGEAWRPIPGWPYAASSLGRIGRVQAARGARAGHVLRPKPNRSGHHMVDLSRGNQVKRFHVARLICLAFHGRPPSRRHNALHRDGDTANNRPGNVYWGTQAENVEDSRRHGTITAGERHGNAKITDDDVRTMRRLRAGGATYKQLAARFGIAPSTVSDACLGRQWSHVPMTATTEAAAPAAWQKGYSLDALKAFAGIFKDRQKPLVFGAFGLTKERDIADALAANALVWRRGADGAPGACAIGKALKAPGSFTDFAGREFSVPKGHVRIGAFACRDPEVGAGVLASIVARGVPVWLEAFEEDATSRAALERVPQLRYLATKIAAGSEVKGIYTTAEVSAPPLHLAERAAVLPVVRDFVGPAEREAMLAEADAFAAWAQHYSSYNKRQSWTAYALRGYDAADPTFIVKPAEMAQSWKAENPERLKARPAWTAAADRFPRTMEVVRRILGGRDADRVRLMRLAPKGELARHADITDRDAGLADGRLCRLHLPLRTSDGVVVHGWDKRGRHIETRFPAGALCYLDQRGPHRVENRDPTLDRVHLVLDVISDRGLRDMIAGAM